MRAAASLFLVLLISVGFAACIEWTTDSQGNLRSVGVPGVPIWTAQATTTPESQVSLPTPDPESAELAADVYVPGEWLAELNRWRGLAGENPVAENSALDAGSQAHARYLVMQGPSDDAGFRLYTHQLGGAAHTESPSSPWYSLDGAQAAGGGKPAIGVMQSADVAYSVNETSDIEEWLIGPFHRFSLLAPWAQVAGYGSFGKYPRRAAALALRGRIQGERNHAAVEFPPANGSIAIRSMTFREWPDPLEACPGYKLPVGLPISLQFGRRVELASYSVRDETEDRSIEACAFDEASYHSGDPGAQRRARQLLKLYGAIVLIPRHPLIVGHRYRVDIKTQRHVLSWDFAVVSPSRPDATL